MQPQELSISNYLLYQEAVKRGFKVDIIDHITLILHKGGHTRYVRGSRTQAQSAVGYLFTENKEVTKKILDYFDIQTAKHVVIQAPSDIRLLDQLSFPVVIKPSDGAHGDNVHVNITTRDRALEIIYKLQGQAKKLLVEEMLIGQEYRVTCVDYKVVAVTMRKPAFVQGDGESTIDQLINIKNLHPWRGESLTFNTPHIKIKTDEFLLECLTEQNLKLESVLPNGVEAYLRKNSNISTGGDPFNVTESVCRENIQLFEHITKVCDLNTSGIDIICTDITQPIVNQTKAGVVELNSSPALSTPQFPLSGTSVNVAGKVMDMLERSLEE